MRLINTISILVLCALPALAFEGGELSAVQAQALEALRAAENDGALDRRGGCNLFNARVRRDWFVGSGTCKN